MPRGSPSIEDLEDGKERIEAEIGFLKMECSRLSSRERIEAYATEHLGLRHPTGDEVVRLGPEHAQPEPQQTSYAGRNAGGPDNG